MAGATMKPFAEKILYFPARVLFAAGFRLMAFACWLNNDVIHLTAQIHDRGECSTCLGSDLRIEAEEENT